MFKKTKTTAQIKKKARETRNKNKCIEERRKHYKKFFCFEKKGAGKKRILFEEVAQFNS